MRIAFENVTYVYGRGTPFEKEALSGVSLVIPSGAFVGVIGPTGSGKSTLVQHLNGLLRPASGVVRVGEFVWSPDAKPQPDWRRQVGLVFQYPEHQLFEETVSRDVSFGPLNFGFPEDLVQVRVREALELVGLSWEEVKDRSPFQLSGGQMRRVAIAGVLAMQPKVLVLDEPTAGLDPAGRREILEGIHRIHREQRLTTILVTHSMEDAARYADLIVVMSEGRVALQGTPAEVFAREEELHRLGLDVPEVVRLVRKLNRRLPPERQIPAGLYREEELAEHLFQLLGRKRGVTR